MAWRTRYFRFTCLRDLVCMACPMCPFSFITLEKALRGEIWQEGCRGREHASLRDPSERRRLLRHQCLIAIDPILSRQYLRKRVTELHVPARSPLLQDRTGRRVDREWTAQKTHCVGCRANGKSRRGARRKREKVKVLSGHSTKQ